MTLRAEHLGPPPLGEDGAHPIEAESYRLMRATLDLGGLDPLGQAVVERIVHASADPSLAKGVIAPEEDLRAGLERLSEGCEVVTDVEMTRAGLHAGLRARARCYLGEVTEAGGFPTRSAASMNLAALRHPEAFFVVGCAPTALFQLLELAGRGEISPAFVVGLPVGLVGAAESKAALAASPIPCVTNRGSRGGSAMAAAATNALWRIASAGAGAGGGDG